MKIFDGVVPTCDATHFDWPHISRLFEKYGWPTNLCREAYEINIEDETQIQQYQEALSKYQDDHPLDQHNALIDARSLQVAWQAAKGRE